jgi:hypothetical protein
VAGPQQGPWAKYGGNPAPWEKYGAKPTVQPQPTPDTNAQPEPSFLNTLGREASSTVSGIAGIPGGIYHAIADPATPEESQELQSKGLDPNSTLDLAGHRMVAHPLQVAADWYKGVAQGKVPSAYEQALSVAPEAMGAGAAGVLGSKLIESAPGAAKSAYNAAKGPMGDAVIAGIKQAPIAAIKNTPILGKIAKDVYKSGAKAYKAAKPAPIPEPVPEVPVPETPKMASPPDQAAPLGRVPVKVVRQSSALGPNAKVLSQAQPLAEVPARPVSVPVAAPEPVEAGEAPYPTTPSAYGPPKRDFQGNVPAENQGFPPYKVEEPKQDLGEIQREGTERRMGGPLPRGGVERRVVSTPEIATPQRFSENPRFDYQATGQKPAPYIWEAGGRGRGDFLDDKAIQQELGQQLDAEGRGIESQAARDFAARNSMDTPKGELIRQSRIAKPGDIEPEVKPIKYTPTPGVKLPEDLTDALQKSLEEAKRRRAQK